MKLTSMPGLATISDRVRFTDAAGLGIKPPRIRVVMHSLVMLAFAMVRKLKIEIVHWQLISTTTSRLLI